MDLLQSRVDSFLKSRRVKKSSAKRQATTASVKWPHPASFKATPTSLAEAGFYYNPSWEDKDNVTCFMCSKELSDWAEEDDPFDIHWLKCRTTCPWAIVRCGLKYDLGDDGNFIFPNATRLPSSKTMENARLDTFHMDDPWPHNTTKNHGANAKKMAQAGFVYTPQTSGDDTASCLYCNISLSGWDASDDPLKEHRKRMKKSGITCPFFATKGPKSKKKAPVNVDDMDLPGPAMEDDEVVAPVEKPKKGRPVSKKTTAPVPMSIDVDDPDPPPPPPLTPPSIPSTPQKTVATTTQHAEVPPATAPVPPVPTLVTIPNWTSIPENERDMTVEQWIRHEIALQHEQMQADGNNRIVMFKQRAADVRKRIEAL